MRVKNEEEEEENEEFTYVAKSVKARRWMKKYYLKTIM